MSRPKLAILCGTTPTRRSECDRLVRSLLDHTLNVDWTLYLGDLTAPPTAIYTFPSAPVRTTREHPPKGVSKGYNALAALGDEEWVCWLNDDVEVCQGWAEAAISALEATPRAGLAALYYLTPHPPAGWHVNEFPAGLPYANFGLLRRSLFTDVGGFDERVPLYGCDNALAFRVLAAGYGILPVPDARIIHHFRNDVSRAVNMERYDRGGWLDALSEWHPRLGDLRATQRDAEITYELVLPENDTYVQRYGEVL